MRHLLRYAIAAYEWRHRRAFEAAAAHPVSAQTRLLRRLLADNADTAFGREHGFAAIGTPADFGRRVPIGDYEAFRPWVARIAAGERRVLTTETPVMFTAPSGTTSEPEHVAPPRGHGVAPRRRPRARGARRHPRRRPRRADGSRGPGRA